MARILFVDDDPLTLETLSKAVGVFGHKASLAGSGQQGISLAQAEKPDIIFVDMNLPDMGGLDLVRQLRASDSTQSIPIMILSAGPELEARDLAKEAGAQDYLTKPFRLQALLEIIKDYTGG